MCTIQHLVVKTDNCHIVAYLYTRDKAYWRFAASMLEDKVTYIFQVISKQFNAHIIVNKYFSQFIDVVYKHQWSSSTSLYYTTC